MKAYVKVHGIPQAQKALKGVQRKALTELSKSVREAANMVKRAAKATVLFQDKKGLLRKAIRAKIYRKKGTVVKYKVGPDPTKAPHGQLVELGHAKVFRTSAGTLVNLGKVKGRGYMKAAFNAVEQQAKSHITQGLKRILA